MAARISFQARLISSLGMSPSISILDLVARHAPIGGYQLRFRQTIECREPPASGENRERFLLASGLHRQIIQEAVVVNALRKSLNAVFSASLAHVRRGWVQL